MSTVVVVVVVRPCRFIISCSVFFDVLSKFFLGNGMFKFDFVNFCVCVCVCVYVFVVMLFLLYFLMLIVKFCVILKISSCFVCWVVVVVVCA